MKHNAATLAGWSAGAIALGDPERLITELVIDSRKVDRPEEAIFIALRTERRNGHDFIHAAYEKGIRCFLISEKLTGGGLDGATIIEVKDTLTALQGIAAANRAQYTIPVTGITGSNGKTIVKEWLYQLLTPDVNIVRNPKSYNSQVGVPLSVWMLHREAQLGIFEAGISQPGEMDRLEKIIRPTTGIFTNIGEAHSEGFLSNRQKINEKLLLFRHVDTLIYCRDYPELHEAMVQFHRNMNNSGEAETLRLVSWSQKSEADLCITAFMRDAHNTTILAEWQQREVRITIPFTDNASVENATHCWCYLLLQGLSDAVIAERMMRLQPVAMRLELRNGINESSIINDAYNSDLTSFSIALDYLDQQKQHLQRTVILSDMLQSAQSPAMLYEQVADMVARRAVQRFIGIGPALYKHKAAFRRHKKLRSVFFKSTQDFIRNFHLMTFGREAILLKGARAFHFEQIGKLLEQEVHQTVLSVNLSALIHNLNVYRSHAGEGVKLMAMVKAFSYGSGSYEVAQALQHAGIAYLSVAYADEGVQLRKGGITMPIMVMSPDAIAFDRMIAWKLEPELFNLRSLEAFTAMAKNLGVVHYPVHIKLDTGMHRLGFMPDEIPALLEALKDNEQVKVASVFSHLAAAEDESMDSFTQQQAAAFEHMSYLIAQGIGYMPIQHLCNSAGIARFPNLHYNMVRLGLGLYGIDSSKQLQERLKQVGTLRTTIAQIKNLPPGDTVGYGRKGKASRIATISIGYADGYPRALGHGTAHVLIHGKPAPTVGVICMDMCMVDISNIPEAQEGDSVIIFGPELPVTQLAAWSGTISYELMTGISQRVKRVYVQED